MSKKKTKEQIEKENNLIKLFCDEDENGNFIGKSREEFIEVLNEVFDIKNKNDMPFSVEDIIQQPELKDFTFEGVQDLKYVCKLKPHRVQILKECSKKQKEKTGGRINEHLEACEFDNEAIEDIFNNALGIVYMLTGVVNGKEYIIKIGESRKTAKERLASYNCGAIINWRTASTTNIKILQSFILNDSVEYKLYLYDCCRPIIFEWHGRKSSPVASSESIGYEEILNQAFIEQFGRPALANIQVKTGTSKLNLRKDVNV